MVQGTASDVGKSLIVAALCRIFTDMGYRVAPFKSQNMALNSFATIEGHEIGRAQALQAMAAKISPTVDMNPILLKPTDSSQAQVIVHGKVYKNLSARDYYLEKSRLISVVEKSLNKLKKSFDMVIIEGAGSPAEINLKQQDIANMRIARMANAPVILVGDIDRGGVFASIVGTLDLLDEDERNRVKGIVINKFRGDVGLLKPGIDFLEERTAKKVLGIIPYISGLKIDSEDSLALDNKRSMGYDTGTNPSDSASHNGAIKIAVIRLPHISNFTDIDTFSHEPDVELRYVVPGAKIEDTDLLIIPGTKNTVADMQTLYEKGTVFEIRNLRRKGIPIIGLCGGYQMLGNLIEDEHGIESGLKAIEGIGLLDCTTSICQSKVTMQVEAVVSGTGEILGPVRGQKVAGYEIHMGTTRSANGAAEAFRIKKRGESAEDIADGCVSDDGLVFGTYIHGLFDNGNIRKSLLDFLKARRGFERNSADIDYDVYRQSQIDYLADTVAKNLDIDYLLKEVLGV